ncbi:MAG: hypothetical protein FWE07_02275 [Turicibacter sp.]|nr:hypothetical protein [Turicibacter sp.]
MKNKRSKCSIYYNSTKKKQRKQEKNQHSPYKTRQKSERNASSIVFPFLMDDQSGVGSHDSTTSGSTSTHGKTSRSDYTYEKGQPTETYCYEFTNSKFIYFLGNLTPKQYLVFITLVALIITEELNQTEAKIIFAFLSNVTDTIQTLVEQEIILNNYRLNKNSRELGNALHHDFDNIYAELDRIKKQLPTS